jgi:hypothetical protein
MSAQKTSSFSLTAMQKEALGVLASAASFVCLYGSSRSGKTFLMVYACVVRAFKAPGSRHLIARKLLRSVRSAVVLDTFPKVMKLAFPHQNYKMHKGEDLYVEFDNGSEIWFCGLDSNDNVEKILGMEFCTIFISEISECIYESFSILLTRLAQKSMDTMKAEFLPLKLYADLNPVSKHHWCYKLFMLKESPVDGGKLPNGDDYITMQMNIGGNLEHVNKSYVKTVLEGLPLRQRKRFLDGEWQEHLDGVLWEYSWIDSNRVQRGPKPVAIAVGVDPAITAKDASAETGIVAGFRGEDGHIYITDDRSLRAKPERWGKVVCAVYEETMAQHVVAEVNQGGDLVESNIKVANPTVPVRMVRASRGKAVRAEPVAALYQKGFVHHVGFLPELEDQLTEWDPSREGPSPDRADALVWLIHDLAIDMLYRQPHVSSSAASTNVEPRAIEEYSIQEILSTEELWS